MVWHVHKWSVKHYLYLHKEVSKVLLESWDVVVEMEQSLDKNTNLGSDIYKGRDREWHTHK